MQVHVSLPHVLTSAEHMCTPRAEHIRARVQGAREFATCADVSRAHVHSTCRAHPEQEYKEHVSLPHVLTSAEHS